MTRLYLYSPCRCCHHHRYHHTQTRRRSASVRAHTHILISEDVQRVCEQRPPSKSVNMPLFVGPSATLGYGPPAAARRSCDCGRNYSNCEFRCHRGMIWDRPFPLSVPTQFDDGDTSMHTHTHTHTSYCMHTYIPKFTGKNSTTNIAMNMIIELASNTKQCTTICCSLRWGKT